jgi:hypothetical protein
VKTRFQNLPFKFNLQRYIPGVVDTMREWFRTYKLAVGAVHVERS